MKVRFGRFLLLFLLFIMTIFTYSQQSCSASTDKIIIPERFSELRVSTNLSIYVDRFSKTADQDILNKQDQFLPLKDADVAGDLSKATYWLRLNLVNSTDREKQVILELKKPHLSSIKLFSVNNQKLNMNEKMGYGYSFNSRIIKHRNMVFTLTLPPQTTEVFYLKIKTDSFFQAPVSIWDPVAFSIANYNAQTLFGLFYGIMLAMIIYNGFLFFSLKERTYLYYILYLTGFTLLQLIWDGFAFQWLWGNFPWWALRSNSFFIIWTALFSLQFTNHFLQLKWSAPRLHKLVTIYVIACSFLLIVPFILSIQLSILISMAAVSLLAVLIIGVVCKVRLYTREAKYYIIAFSLLLIGIILNLLAGYKLIPLTPLSLYAPKLGAVVQVLVLSLGLADKIKRVTLEKEQESRKYYIQTYLQGSFNQMAKCKELDHLVDSGLHCLMAVTKHENGIYLVKEGGFWKPLLNNGNEIIVDPYIMIQEQYAEKPLTIKDVNVNLLGIHNKSQSLLTIPIHTEYHSGMFIVFSKVKSELLPFETESIVPSFTSQLTVLIDNLFHYQHLEKSAQYDHLTNIFNRKHFLEMANEVLTLSSKLDSPVSMLLIDIDYFKKVNDHYGHTIGDEAIVFVANIIKLTCKELGIVGRYGGEEFIACLPQTTYQKANEVANSIIEAFHLQPFSHDNGITIPLTVSIGVCSNQYEAMSLQEMIDRSDKALYKAKKNGRDQTVLCVH